MQGFFRELVDDAIKLLRRIAPHEFGSTQIYIASQEILTPGLGSNGTLAFTGRTVDLLLRPMVDRWNGRGFGVVICEEALRDYVGESPRELRLALSGVLLHEAAHFIDGRYADAPAPPEAVLKFQQHQLLTPPPYVPREKHTPEYFDDRKYEFFTHGPSFIRIALHLKRRAEILVGMRGIDAIDVIGKYSAVPAEDYEQALADEPIRCLHRSFADIEKKAPPASFADCWRHALKLYEQESL